MTLKEKAVVAVLGLLILGAVAYLALYAPIGSLGSYDGQNYDVDRFAIIGYLLFFLIVGCLVVRSQCRSQAKTVTQKAEPDDTVWPPPPTKEPGVDTPGSQSERG